MTEDEARKKWCPMSRINTGEAPNVSFNRITTDAFLENKSAAVGMCIASDCMMWRERCLPGEGIPKKEDYIGFCGLATG
jgi:hypothetical protein